jgi:hypothetical protein
MADLSIEIHDKTLKRVGWVNDPTSLTVTARHNNIGSAELVVPSDHRRLPLLLADGARLVIDYRGERLMSGYIRNPSGDLGGPDGTMTLPVQDDLWILERVLGWPVPTAAIDAQGAKATDTRTGPAETIAKGYLTGVLAHNTVDPITVAADLARGATITAVSSRMQQLSEVLLTLVDGAGIGLRAVQQGNRIIFDAYVPKVFTRKLSRQSGTLLTATWSRGDATMTRAVAGGPNTGTSREFGLIKDAALEAAYGYTIEVLVDAQSAASSTARDTQGSQALAAAGRKFGFTVTLSESAAFRYGGTNGVHVGDKITIREGGQDYTDVLREAKLTFDRDGGLQVQPSIGEHTDDPDRMLAIFLGRAWSGLKNLRTR